MSETKIPGIKAKHAIITPACLAGRVRHVVILEALDRLEKEAELLIAHEANQGAKFHLVLTVERPE